MKQDDFLCPFCGSEQAEIQENGLAVCYDCDEEWDPYEAAAKRSSL